MMQVVEMDMRVPLDEYVISGRLDLVQTDGVRAIITDYKTSQRMIPQHEFEKSVQTFLYAWGIREQYPGVEEFTVREHYVRYDAPARTVTFGRGDLNVESYMRVVAGRLMAAFDREPEDGLDAFPPTPGDHCGFCPRPHVCPKRGISEWVPGDDGHAVRLLEWLAVTEAKRTLKAEITQRDRPLTAHGMTAGFDVKHVTRIDKDALVEAGVDLTAFQTTDDRTEFHVRKAREEDEQT
jgi:PD-(D/E)XK nuclease superfamily